MTENASPSGPRPKETNEVEINLGGLVVGIVILICLIWSLLTGEMPFAYLNVALLFALALGNHIVNSIYD